MNLSLFIGKRYVSASRGKGFISVFSIISVIGIAVGIMALIVVLSVMNGVTSEVRQKILSMTAHVKVLNTAGNEGVFSKDFDINKYTSKYPDIVASAPFIEGQALIGESQNFHGVVVNGIDSARETSVADALATKETKKSIDTLKSGEFNIVIGKLLAQQLEVNVGDKITLLVPKMTVSAAGIIPRIKRFTVSGFFESGHYLYDTGLILINIDDAATLFQKTNIDGFQLKLTDLFKAPNIAENLNKSLPSTLYAYDWTHENKAYFEAVKAEKAAMFFILLIIVAVAAANILSTLIMVVMDKKKDIAILRTLGMSSTTISGIFIVQGMILGILGTLLGVFLGVVISLNVPNIMGFIDVHFGFRLPQELYFISSLNPKIDPSLVLLISVCSLVLSFFATILPAIKASRFHPARALAYE